jgi:hypothetical protein
VHLNGSPEAILGDLFDLSDLPLMLVVGIKEVAGLELAVKIIGFKL